MKKVVVFSIIMIGLTSCLSMREPDLSTKESFQMGNTSSSEMTLRFYEEGKPIVVYAEIYNQSTPIFVPQTDDRKNIDSLMCDSILILKPGQTILFYDRYRGNRGYLVCLPICGYGKSIKQDSNSKEKLNQKSKKKKCSSNTKYSFLKI